ncbi:hypothetical protein QQF64_018575 [Cirrhinus molitorella]|uniref:FISNA domain-containing protein n=1 Tax=Cirrhinus molitorella TaxID=172907 RepID=A0ABR3LGG7_9TELE
MAFRHDTQKKTLKSLIQEGESDLPEHIDMSVRKKQPMNLSDLCREEDSSVESRLWQNESPEPSCVSMKSDESMGQPAKFSSGDSSADLSQKHRPRGPESHTAKKNLDSIFKELEHKIISELKSFKRLLSPDYPECSERDRYDDEGHSRVREGLLKITLLILRKMNHTDLANTLQTKLMPVYQQKLKSRLQDKYQRISEGMSNHGDSTRLNEIYTELYITEGGSGEVNNEHELLSFSEQNTGLRNEFRSPMTSLLKREVDKALQKEELNEFVLSKYDRSEECLLRLLPVIKASRKVNLSDCGITQKGCAALISTLRSNPSHMRELDLSDNKPGDSGVNLLCALLEDPHCKLEKLRLYNCSIEEESCAALISALRSNPSHLRELDLSYNEPGDSGVNLLCAVLEDPHCKLEKLWLRYCSIEEEGCAALISALRSNSSHLRELDLRYNTPGDSGLKLHTALLEDPHCKLKKL